MGIKKSSNRFDDNVKRFCMRVCLILEYIVAVFVLVSLVRAIIHMIPSLTEYIMDPFASSPFIAFLNSMLTLIIGIEFLKMLCQPNSDNVLETIIFLIARHCIIESDVSSMDYLMFTVCLILLCLTRRYLSRTRVEHETSPSKEKTEQAENFKK